MRPLVSVFVKYSNDELFRSQAQQWWERQTYKNIEFITDSWDLSRANGKYILITDDNNLYCEETIETLVKVAEEQRTDMLFFCMESHWESASDARATSSVNFAYPFLPYRHNGMPLVNSVFFNGVNPMIEACFFNREFLARNKMLGVGDAMTFVRRCLMYNPRVYTVKAFFGNHIIRVNQGHRSAHEFIKSEIENFVNLRTYARASRKTKKWVRTINDSIRRLSLDTAMGLMSKVVPLDHIPQCSIHLVDHCNLNCKSCSHFSCLARAGDFELQVDDFKRDIIRLRKITKGKIKILELYGGEPLLHPNVIPFMKYTRLMFPNSLIRFITNGILLPTQKPEFWRAVKRYNITISPTKYPINVDWDRVQELANQYKVPIDFFGGTGFCQKTLYHKPLDITGRQNAAESFINCQHTRCINMYQGRLFHCPIVAYIKYFNREFGTELNPCMADSLDIYEKGITPQDVFDFCARPIPFCRYCFARGTTHGHPWEVTKKDISEWTMLRKRQ